MPDYSDAELRAVLDRVHIIAMVGASTNWNRPSAFVMKYLQGKGYRVIPVNPTAAGQVLFGETIYPDLAAIPEPVDMVDIFRAPQFVPDCVEAAIAIGAKVVWMQLGVVHEAAAEKARAAGLAVVMDRCPKIEWARLHGEIGWGGFNSGVISSRRPALRGRGQ